MITNYSVFNDKEPVLVNNRKERRFLFLFKMIGVAKKFKQADLSSGIRSL